MSEGSLTVNSWVGGPQDDTVISWDWGTLYFYSYFPFPFPFPSLIPVPVAWQLSLREREATVASHFIQAITFVKYIFKWWKELWQFKPTHPLLFPFSWPMDQIFSFENLSHRKCSGGVCWAFVMFLKALLCFNLIFFNDFVIYSHFPTRLLINICTQRNINFSLSLQPCGTTEWEVDEISLGRCINETGPENFRYGFEIN